MNQLDFSLFDNLIEGIQVLSPRFEYIYVNEAMGLQINCTPQELIGHRVLDKFPGLANTELFIQTNRCMKERTNLEIVQKYKFRDGVEKWFQIKVQPFEDGLLLMSWDITKTKQVEEKLKKKEKAYRKLFEEMQEYFLVQEAVYNDQNEIVDLKLVAINSMAANLVDKTPEELIGRMVTEQLGPLEGSMLEITNRVILNSESVRYEKFMPSLNRWLNIHSYSPQPNQIASLILDITEAKMSELEWEKINQQLDFIVKNRTSELAEALAREQKLSTVKSNFLSMAAHELKTPLSAILLIVSVLDRIAEHGETEDREKYHRYIEEQAKELLRLLDSFVAPFHREIGGGQLAYETFDLFVFLEQICEEFQCLCKEGQQILMQFEGERILEQDKGILRRIIINLLTNAIKYSQKDIVISSNLQHNNLTLRIKDEGMGIPEADQAKVFDPYFRASNSKGIPGTGLGLNIVKMYVEQIGGNISFVSNENEGTTFMVSVLD